MTKDELEEQIKSHSPRWWREAQTHVGRKNKYVCAVDRMHYIVTVDVDPGVTPSSIACGTRFMEGYGCVGRMRSRLYTSSQQAYAGWGWYRPESVDGIFGKSEAQHEHVLNGGLLLRKLS